MRALALTTVCSAVGEILFQATMLHELFPVPLAVACGNALIHDLLSYDQRLSWQATSFTACIPIHNNFPVLALDIFDLKKGVLLNRFGHIGAN
jgi:hypothetical protein